MNIQLEVNEICLLCKISQQTTNHNNNAIQSIEFVCRSTFHYIMCMACPFSLDHLQQSRTYEKTSNYITKHSCKTFEFLHINIHIRQTARRICMRIRNYRHFNLRQLKQRRYAFPCLDTRSLSSIRIDKDLY